MLIFSRKDETFIIRCDRYYNNLTNFDCKTCTLGVSLSCKLCILKELKKTKANYNVYFLDSIKNMCSNTSLYASSFYFNSKTLVTSTSILILSVIIKVYQKVFFLIPLNLVFQIIPIENLGALMTFSHMICSDFQRTR